MVQSAIDQIDCKPSKMIEWIYLEKKEIFKFDFYVICVGIRTRVILMPSHYLGLHRFARVPYLCQRKFKRAKKHFLGGKGMAEAEVEFKRVTYLEDLCLLI